MTKWTASVATFLVLLVLVGLFHGRPVGTPGYRGPFHWTRMEIKEAQVSRASAFPVYASIDKMSEIFQMEVGDECYFLKDDGWRWRDTKDPGFALAPVFCPKKGGGWAMLPRD